MDKNSKIRGRQQGSKNRMTQRTKQYLGEAISPHIKEVFKNINALDPEQRIRILIKCLPYFLSKGKVSDEETEVQKILYEQLLPHYKKIDIYFNHLPLEEKGKVLVQLLKMLTPQQISAVAPIINRKLKRPGRSSKSNHSSEH